MKRFSTPGSCTVWRGSANDSILDQPPILAPHINLDAGTITVQGAAGFVRAKISTGFSLLFSQNRPPARPDMAYLEQEPPLVATGSPATVTPISA